MGESWLEVVLGVSFRLFELFATNLGSILALLMAYFGYRLMIPALSLINDPQREVSYQRFLLALIPGALFAIPGIATVLAPGNMGLLLFLMILIVGAGFGFALLGYNLFRRGVLDTSDVEAVWANKSLLIRRAAPGTLFALYGLAVITVCLFTVPKIMKDYYELQAKSASEIAGVINTVGSDAISLLEAYLDGDGDKPTSP